MNMKIGFLMTAFAIQPLVALEFTQTLKPVQLAQAAVSEKSIEQVYGWFDCCSVEERIEVGQILKQHMIEWLNTNGARDAYVKKIDRQHFDAKARACMSTVCTVGVFVFTGLALYHYYLKNAAVEAHMESVRQALRQMHKTTDPNLRNVNYVVNNIPISSPWCVDGNDLDRVYDLVWSTPHNYDMFSDDAVGMGAWCVAGSLVAAFVKEEKIADEETLAVYDRMNALVAYLEK